MYPRKLVYFHSNLELESVNMNCLCQLRQSAVRHLRQLCRNKFLQCHLVDIRIFHMTHHPLRNYKLGEQIWNYNDRNRLCNRCNSEYFGNLFELFVQFQLARFCHCHRVPFNNWTNLRKNGLNRDLNPGPLAPKARIIPLDHWALSDHLLWVDLN